MANADRTKKLWGLLYIKLMPIAAVIQKWLQKRWIRISLQLLILTFSGIYLVSSFQSIDLSTLELSLNYLNLFWASLITLVALVLGALGWWLTLVSTGQASKLSEAIRIHSVSNLAKYIPGYAWQLLSKGYLTRKTGISAKTIGIAMTLELVQIFLGGIWLIILFFPDELYQKNVIIQQLGDYFDALKYSLLVLVGLFPVLLPGIVRRINPLAAAVRVNSYQLSLATLSIVAGWLLFGIAFWLIGNAFVPISFEHIPLFVYSLAVSFLIGLLIIIVPASIGVRESLMVFLLSGLLTAPIAVIVAAMSRLILTICELFFTGTILLLSRLGRSSR